MNYLLLKIVLIVYLFVNIYFIRQISKSKILETRQKVINSVLIWFIPILWYIILKIYINEESPTVTRAYREEQRKNKKQGGFYESGKGFYGGLQD